MTHLRRLAVALLLALVALGTAAALLVVAGVGHGTLEPAAVDARADRPVAVEKAGRTGARFAPAVVRRGPTPHGPVTAGTVIERALVPGPTLLASGAEGDDVRDLQARLAQIAWFSGPPSGTYADITAAAVRGFQAKREIPVTGEVDQRTLDRLLAMTNEPTEAELTGTVEDSAGNTPGALDPRCLDGRVLCIDKTSSTLRWVVDGTVRRTLDARFGAADTPTREGLFEVTIKSRDHVSSLFESSMPFAMFFSGGEAVHYSSDFAATGYAGASHGCVNIRDYDAIAALFDEVQVGDPVVVYRS